MHRIRRICYIASGDLYHHSQVLILIILILIVICSDGLKLSWAIGTFF